MRSAERPGDSAPRSDGAAGTDEGTVGADWHAGLAYALTGHWLDVSIVEEPMVDRLLADLESCGWNRMRLTDAARNTHALPPEWARQLGAARFAAVLGDLRRRLATCRAETRISATDRPLDADEQRLTADRPPHWS